MSTLFMARLRSICWIAFIISALSCCPSVNPGNDAMAAAGESSRQKVQKAVDAAYAAREALGLPGKPNKR
jgi:hypothetical protein